jgi:hypothetical protein
VSIDPPHAEMRISPTHVFQFVESDAFATERFSPPKDDNFKQFILNQDLLRISLPAFPKLYARPGKLRVFTELDETGEEKGVECRSANGVLPIAVITVPNLEGLEPVLQYCYRPHPLVLLDLLLGEPLVDFGESYHQVVFADPNRTEEKLWLLIQKGIRVSRRIALSQPIPLDKFDQLLLSRIHSVDAVARVAGAFRLGCPKFWEVLRIVRSVLFNAAVYRYQEAHKDKYPDRFGLEGSP